jgi:phage terminase large subunit-like protein
VIDIHQKLGLPPAGKSWIQVIANLPPNEQAELLTQLPDGELKSLQTDWAFIGRREQIIDTTGDEYASVLLTPGRGWGKSFCISHSIKSRLDLGARRICLIGPTVSETKKVSILGESGILAVMDSLEVRVVFKPSLKTITFPGYAHEPVLDYFSADAGGDTLRGSQFDSAFMDEICVFNDLEDVLENLDMCMRLGRKYDLNTFILMATTPRPVPAYKKLLEDPAVLKVRGSTLDNLQNLSVNFRKNTIDKYKGTRVYDQEINGELLSDSENALFVRDQLNKDRVSEAPEFELVVLALDATSGKGKKANDECGIIVAGRSKGQDGKDHAYVVNDSSGRMAPRDWAKRVAILYNQFDVDMVFAESNQGGEMIATTLEQYAPHIVVELKHSDTGKTSRAEPISLLSDQGRIHMVGHHVELEDQLCNMTVPQTSGVLDDRADAFVFACAKLLTTGKGAKKKSCGSWR